MSNVEGCLKFFDPGGKNRGDGKGDTGDSGMGDGMLAEDGRRGWGLSSWVVLVRDFLFGEGDLRNTSPRSPDTRLCAGGPIGCRGLCRVILDRLRRVNCSVPRKVDH